MPIAAVEPVPVRAAVPELLAPAGEWESMRAAVANGADAVYFGLDQFNARHRATNFTLEELPEVMGYLHGHNVKGFLAFNTLIFSDELPAAADYVRAIAAAGVDAVIVQDLGLAKLIAAIVPTLPVHGSTQMTLTEPRGIRFVQSLGVKRVVLARELSVTDIGKIAAATAMPLEVFIHGALCVAYSGQCLTSEALGGRSANRGQCAQACRLPYDLMVDGTRREMGDKSYLLSPQDLAAPDLVADLAQIGVASLKIEGRLKSAPYVAATTQTYRAALDAVGERKAFHLSAQQRGDLEQTFSRGFTHGFLSGVNHQELVVARSPKSRGRRMGTVVAVGRQSVTIERRGEVPVNLGDGIVFDEGHPDQPEQGGRVFAVRPRGRDRIEIELGRRDVDLAAIAVGAIVWKTDDPAVRKRLEQSFSRDGIIRRSPVAATVRAHVGKPLTVIFDDGRTRVQAFSEAPLQAAQKIVFTEATAREQLGRLGDTPYELTTLTCDIAGGPMVPKSVLNDLRRKAVEQLLQGRATSHTIAEPDALARLRKERPAPSPGKPGEGWGEGDFDHQAALGEASNAHPRALPEYRAREPSLYVLVRSLEQLDAVLAWPGSPRPAMIYCDFEDVRAYSAAVERCRAAHMPVALATLRVIKPGEEGFLRQLADASPDAILVRNLAAIGFFQEERPGLPLIGDYALNIANELTAQLFTQSGLVRQVPSYDLNWSQMKAMLSHTAADQFEIVVHQHMPMFHVEHCVFAHTLSTGKDYRDCGRPCERHVVDLRDRVGESHPLIADVGCRNTVFNAAAQSAAEFIPPMRQVGLSHFRIELLRESAAPVSALLDQYAGVIRGDTPPRSAVRSLRVLSQLGVTRGTLDRA